MYPSNWSLTYTCRNNFKSFSHDLPNRRCFWSISPSLLIPLCATETMTPTPQPPNLNPPKPHRHWDCCLLNCQSTETQRLRFLNSEWKKKKKKKWWNQGFLSAILVGSMLGLMQMAKCLWLAMSAVSPFANLALISKSVRAAESAWDVALPI